MLRGVCGGVEMFVANPANKLEPPLVELPVAAIPGTLPPPTRGGLLTMVPVGTASEDCVATEEVEFDRVGLEGRILALITSPVLCATKWLDDVR